MGRKSIWLPGRQVCVAVCVSILAGCGSSPATTVVVVTATPRVAVTATSPPKSHAGAADFTRSNWATLDTDPNAHKGASVEIVGKVFINPQRDSKGTYWQMWADPKNTAWNTVVSLAHANFQVSNQDFVRVVGTVKGKYEGKNVFGGDVSAVALSASSAKVVDAIAAATPALRVAQVHQSQTQYGITVAVQRAEFAPDETRVFVTVANGSSYKAHFYAFNAKAVQGTTQFSAKAFSAYPEVQSDILQMSIHQA